MAVPTYSANGNKATTVAKLDPVVFGIEVKNHELLKAAYLAYLGNGRQNSAVTKTRGEVRGGGRKPWKQKGTGRARFGSSRNPIWRGGGITFGPTGEENYRRNLHVKANRTAVRQALSLRASENAVTVIEALSIKTAKTAEIAKLLSKITDRLQIALVVEAKTPELIQATKNLPAVELITAKYLTVFNILNADTLIFTKSALVNLSDWLTPETTV